MNFRARKAFADRRLAELLGRLPEVTSQLYSAQIPIYAVVVHSELELRIRPNPKFFSTKYSLKHEHVLKRKKYLGVRCTLIKN